MMALMKLLRIVIYVSDPVKCASFYRDHFSLKAIGDWNSGWAEVEAEGCVIGFHQAYDENGPVKKATGSPNHPHKISFLATDVEAKRKELLSAGVKMAEVKNFDGWLMCNGVDIEGHVFQITNK